METAHLHAPFWMPTAGSPFPPSWEVNGALLEALLQKYQVPYHLVLKPGCGHHPHSLSQTDELISFLTGKISPLDPDPS